MPVSLSASESDIDESAVVAKAVLRASDALGINKRELSQIIGVSGPSISRLADGNYQLAGKPFELSTYLIRIFRSLDAISHGDEATMRAWMDSENTHLHARPKSEIKSAQGLVRVMSYLDATRAPI